MTTVVLPLSAGTITIFGSYLRSLMAIASSLEILLTRGAHFMAVTTLEWRWDFSAGLTLFRSSIKGSTAAKRLG